ncbi:MAG: metallophosphoesterase [Oscillospiraceae bacterium]|nr:metallophosphoesterase [Oscillospiraceae bacterium]
MSHLFSMRQRAVQKRWLFPPLAILIFLLIALAAVSARRWLHLVWPGLPGAVFWPVYVILPMSIGISYMLPRSVLSRVLHCIGECYLGFFIYMSTAVIALQILHLIARLAGHTFTDRGRCIAGFVVLAVTVAVYLYGVINAFFLRETHYEIEVDLSRSMDLRLVLLSDLHLGFTTGRNMVRRIARKVNALNGDLVLIAGDLFDEAYSTLRRSGQVAADLRSLHGRLGVYACLGNHDMLSDDPRKEDFYRRAGITVLQDETVQIDGITVAGRRDAVCPDRLSVPELLRDRDGPVILLDHQPNQIWAARDAGVDLILSGHTHGGQTFPGNYLVHFMHELSYGYRQYGKTHAFVTSGAGFWGPPLRVLMFNEVVCIDVRFQKEA